MPSSTTTASSITTTLVLLTILLLAFFPNLFHLLWTAPVYLLAPLTWFVPSAPPPQVLAQSGGESADMSWTQTTLTLPPSRSGCFLITDHITTSLPQIKDYKIGLLNLFVQHTSCALSLNENWDEDVRADMTDALDRMVPEDKAGGRSGGGRPLYRHSAEGRDDMPAHIKSALIGASVTIPIKDGKLALGTWQGIWYLEFRAAQHQRKVVATIQGEKFGAGKS